MNNMKINALRSNAETIRIISPTWPVGAEEGNI